jgi:hypothetical protein
MAYSHIAAAAVTAPAPAPATSGQGRGLGRCQVVACPRLAHSRRGLCRPHDNRWKRTWRRAHPDIGDRAAGTGSAKAEFVAWCQTQEPISEGGAAVLRGLPRLVQVELLYGLQERCRRQSGTRLDPFRRLRRLLRQARVASIAEVPAYHGRKLAEHLQRLHQAVPAVAAAGRQALGRRGTAPPPRRRPPQPAPRPSQLPGAPDGRLVGQATIGDLSPRGRSLVARQVARILRDCRDLGLTGPDEICALPWDCLDRDPDGQPVLIYTDFKNNRPGRRLPIGQESAALIVKQQQHVRARFPAAPTADLVLLPPQAQPRTGPRRDRAGGLGPRRAMPADEEIGRVRALIRRVETDLEQLSDDERQQIEEACRVVRATRRVVHLGVPTVRPPTLDPNLRLNHDPDQGPSLEDLA